LPETAIPDAAFLPAPGERDQWGHGLFPQVYICADSLGEYRRGSDLTRVAARMFSPYLGQGAPLDQVAFTQYIGLYQPGGANRLFDETRTGLRPCQGTTSPPGSKPVSFSMPDEHFVGDDSLLYVYTVGGGEISASNPLEIFYTAFVRVGNAVVILVGYERQPHAGPADATTVFRATAIQFAQRAAPYLR